MNHDDPDTPNGAELREKLHLETGRLAWPELQRHFARGVVVVIARDLDLIDVAAAFAQNDAVQTQTWITRGAVARASDTDAQRWQRDNQVFWAVVVAPWVLVQELVD